MKNGLAFEGQRLEGVTCGMSEVEGLANALFGGVFRDDALFDGYALGHHLVET